MNRARRIIRQVAILGALALALIWAHVAASRGLVVSLSEADFTMIGEEQGDWNGYFASPAGDVNGDGLGDAFIGAPIAGEKVCPYPLDPDGNCPGLPKGKGVAYLVLGSPSAEWGEEPLNLAFADASFIGCDTFSMTARQLYAAGDVNGDGYDDLLISGWKCGENYKGKAYLLLGRADVASWGRFYPVEAADASFLGENEMDFLSYYTATAGDVNADGLDDFLISSTHYDVTGTEVITDAGKIYLILGRAAADWGPDFPVSQADASFLGEAVGDRLGRSQVGVGDVNGDGYGDFLIGSISSDYNGEDAGQNYLFLGRAAPGDPGYDPDRPWWGVDFPVAGADASFVGEAEGDESGRRVAAAGDVNDDGYDDFLIGAALNDHAHADAGIAHLMLGRPAADWGLRFPLAEADASFVGEAKRDQAGRRLNGAGDVNGDGYADFLIGAPHNSQSGFAAGAAYLMYGRPAADWGRYYPLAAADATYVGKPEVGVAGYDIAWLGDFSGDGLDDFLIAAYGGRNATHTPGEVYVVLGSRAPKALAFSAEIDTGTPDYWYRFVAEYWDPNGWHDLQQTRLRLEGEQGVSQGFDIRYERDGNLLYLYDVSASIWLGPCQVGELVTLSTPVVQLDCRRSMAISDGRHAVKLGLRVRWQEQPNDPVRLNVFLESTDDAGQTSGLVSFGAWYLGPQRIHLPVVVR